MIKVLASSFYNTLINEEDAISVKTMLEIERIRNDKTLFIIMTNRGFEEILYYNKDYPFIDYIISFNGGIIYDVKNNTVISAMPLSTNKITQVEEVFKKNRKIYYTKNKVYQKFPQEDIYKIEVEVTDKEKDKIDLLNINKSILEINNTYFLEITEETTYEALYKLLRITNIKKNQVTAIIGNESEKEIFTNIKNTHITNRCSNTLKNTLKLQDYNLKNLEEILEKIRNKK